MLLINITKVLFNLLDRFHDRFFLNGLSKLWWLEARLRGANLGSVRFLGRALIKLNPQSIVCIEDNCCLISDQRRVSSGNIYSPCRIQTHLETAQIFIGAGVGLNGTSIVCRSQRISIGAGSMLAPNCVIMDSPFHNLLPASDRKLYEGKDLDQDIWIGKNVWIGSGCLILPGASIGDNSVIGSHSVVKGDILANSLYIGSPARFVRYLS